jgi:EmrB/QacA subfamily drug resistance transporter
MAVEKIVRPHRAVLPLMCVALAAVVSAVASLNVALPDIARATHASQSQIQWIVDAYALVFAALLLPAGAIGDRFGRRRVLLVGLVVFAVGSAAAMAVSSAGALIALRAVLGIGAALVMPATLSIITAEFGAEHRERAVGVWAAVAGASAILGLLGTGALLELGGWQLAFALNCALAIVAFLGTLRAVPESSDPEQAALDPGGTVLSALALGLLVFGTIEAPDHGWLSGLTLGTLAGALVLLVLFVLWELRQERPMLDPRLFRHRAFAAGSLSVTAQFLAFFGFVFIVLQYFQLVRGDSPLLAAVSLVPMALGLIAFTRASPGIVAHIGIRRSAPLGLVLMAAGLGVLAFQTADSSYWLALPGLLLLGAGMGVATAPATTAIVDGLPDAKQGIASAINDVSRELGGALGIALLGSLLNAAYRSGVDGVSAHLPAQAGEHVRQSVGAALQVARLSGPRGAQLADTARDAFLDGLHLALPVAAGILLVTAAALAALLAHAERGDQPSSVRVTSA